MIAEEANAGGVVHRNILPNVLLVENGRHWSNVFVAEAKVHACETSITGLHSLDSDRALRSGHVAREDFLRERHPSGGVLVRRPDRRQKHFLLQASDIEREQPAILDHLPGDRVLARGELAERNFRPGTDTLNQREIRRSQQPEILAVLLVDALDILRDHHLNSGTHLSIGRLLAARAFTAPLAADRADETAFLDIRAPDGVDASALQTEIGDLTKCPVKVEAIVSGCDLVG